MSSEILSGGDYVLDSVSIPSLQRLGGVQSLMRTHYGGECITGVKFCENWENIGGMNGRILTRNELDLTF